MKACKLAHSWTAGRPTGASLLTPTPAPLPPPPAEHSAAEGRNPEARARGRSVCQQCSVCVPSCESVSAAVPLSWCILPLPPVPKLSANSHQPTPPKPKPPPAPCADSLGSYYSIPQGANANNYRSPLAAIQRALPGVTVTFNADSALGYSTTRVRNDINSCNVRPAPALWVAQALRSRCCTGGDQCGASLACLCKCRSILHPPFCPAAQLADACIIFAGSRTYRYLSHTHNQASVSACCVRRPHPTCPGLPTALCYTCRISGPAAQPRPCRHCPQTAYDTIEEGEGHDRLSLLLQARAFALGAQQRKQP